MGNIRFSHQSDHELIHFKQTSGQRKRTNHTAKCGTIGNGLCGKLCGQKTFFRPFFADLGNIWFIGPKSVGDDPDAYFSFDRFYDQLGFNTGLGARFDFDFFLFRVDWGLQLHNPNKQAGERWIRRLTLRQSAFSFNVGFPF